MAKRWLRKIQSDRNPSRKLSHRVSNRILAFGGSETVHGAHRLYVRRLRPFEIILWVVIIGAILMVGVGLLLGFFLIAIPLVVALIAIGIVSAVVRGYFHRQ